ncbi:PQQ-binding-like beta-propeller repeat protein [Alicyclobacillus sp. SO9]|nr:PQQ-binding-like beta-propeller repeat protein [Alicyclobacillus sp. SO9]
MKGELLIGAAASSPMKMQGNGNFYIEHASSGKLSTIALSKGANAFRAAIDGNKAYVPTKQGKTYVINLQSGKVTSSFSSPKGARIANTAKADHLLLITGNSSITAYSLPSLKQKWQLKTGGQALSIAGQTAYLSGQMATKTQIVDLKSGKITGSIPVGHIEDSVYDKQQHTLWLANWNNGQMTIVNTKTNKVEGSVTKKEGGGFNMKNMMKSSGGFMQLAAGPAGKRVYAASFSGNIMVYNAAKNTFAKDIRVGKMSMLSGLAINPSGTVAYTTVENKMETVAVSLKTGKIKHTYPNLMSNRWFVIH